MSEVQPLPFIKWVGGKRKLADDILSRQPSGMKRYIEPFVGGGAVFFALRASGYTGPAILSDVNAELICAYLAVQQEPGRLIDALRLHVNTEEHFYAVRAMDPKALDFVDRGARFIFLNKTAFNGLWRENKSGQMNAPFGHYDNPTICDEPRIRAASVALRNTTILCRPYIEAHDDIRPGDFVYCDPPYIPVSPTASFVGYGKGGFGEQNQYDLAAFALRWAMAGARVVLSNADVPLAHRIYGVEFNRESVQMARAINSKGDRRGKVGELILSIGPLPLARSAA